MHELQQLEEQAKIVKIQKTESRPAQRGSRFTWNICLMAAGLIIISCSVLSTEMAQITMSRCQLDVPLPLTVQSHTNASIQTCSPETITVALDNTSAQHRFHALVQELQQAGKLVPPAFSGKHELLCNATKAETEQWRYCLPISGRKDEPYCNAPDRMDLLIKQGPDRMCYGSAIAHAVWSLLDVQRQACDPIRHSAWRNPEWVSDSIHGGRRHWLPE
jgi:hypothetical protein